MKALLTVLALALLAPAAAAHDARSAAVEIDISGDLVTVHVAVSQAGLHAALEAAAGRALDAGADGYQARVADHLRRTLRLSADGAPLAVGDVGLRLGGHQSDARFLAELPTGARELTVSVESFAAVAGQQTVVRVRRDGETTRAVLSEADGWTLAVPPSTRALTPTPATPTASALPAGVSAALRVWLGLLIAAALAFGFVVVRHPVRRPAVS